VDRKDIEPVKEILAERSRRNRFLQVAVGRGYDAYIDGNRLAVANALDLPVLKHSEQCDLRFRGQIADFVEENRAAVGGFESPQPSLKRAGERAEDIPLLVEYLIERYARTAGKRIRKISRNTLTLFQAYDWPGNIRELQNVIERAVILCDGDTFAVDETWLIHDSKLASDPSIPIGTSLPQQQRIQSQTERQMIETALAATGGRVAGPHGAAAKLGIPRQTLESKITAFGIDKHRYKSR